MVDDRPAQILLQASKQRGAEDAADPSTVERQHLEAGPRPHSIGIRDHVLPGPVSCVTILAVMSQSVTDAGQGRHLTVAKQAFALRSTFRTVPADITPTKLVWTGILTPTPLSRDYTVRITYSVGEYPRVVIVDPPLVPDTGGLLPHFYREGSLCLHRANEWDESMLIVDTIVPWTAEWLAYYELWKRTGRWYGDGDQAEDGVATTVPGLSDDSGARNRAQRRRGDQDEARRTHRKCSFLSRNVLPTAPSCPAPQTSRPGAGR